mmetsp:Transcript_65912/g.157600  ORF Transcript_65912/g.157600 Transcript_65912/m.157600 type:complete len:685 (+) Transcript_65912:168-2222(+)
MQQVIHFIGDSDTTGFGNLVERTASTYLSPAEFEWCKERTSSECAWPKLVAHALHAQAVVVAKESAGVTKASEQLLGLYRERAAQVPPALVVIYLGGNDIEHISFWRCSRNDFAEGYMQVLRCVRKYWPEVAILCLAPHASAVSCCRSKEQQRYIATEMRRLVSAAVHRAGGEAAGIYFQVVEPWPHLEYDRDEDWAASEHWSMKGHEMWAEAVVPLARLILARERARNASGSGLARTSSKRRQSGALFVAMANGDSKEAVDIVLTESCIQELNAEVSLPWERFMQERPFTSAAEFWACLTSSISKQEAQGSSQDAAECLVSGLSALHLAAFQGLTDVALQLLETELFCGVNAEAKALGDQAITALTVAVHMGHYSIAQQLVSNKRFNAVKSGPKWNNLHWVAGSSSEAAGAIAKLLLTENVMDMESINAKDWFGATALHTAATCDNSRVLQVLLECERCDKSTVNATVEAGAAPRSDQAGVLSSTHAGFSRTVTAVAPCSGFTALHCAAFHGHLASANVLLQSSKFTAVNEAVTLERLENAGCTAFHLAAGRGHVQMVQLLLEADSPFTAIDAMTPARHTAVHAAVASGCAAVNVLRTILAAPEGRRPRDFSSRNAMGQTALHMAVNFQQEETAMLLIQHEDFTEVDAQDHSGKTALELAQRAMPGSKVTRFLLRRRRFAHCS